MRFLFNDYENKMSRASNSCNSHELISLDQLSQNEKAKIDLNVNDKSIQTDLKFFSNKCVSTESPEINLKEKKLTQDLEKIDENFLFHPPIFDEEANKSFKFFQSPSDNTLLSQKEAKIKELERKCKEYDAMIYFKDKVLIARETNYLQLQEDLKELKNKLNLIKPLITFKSHLKNDQNLINTNDLKQDEKEMYDDLFPLDSKSVEEKRKSYFINRIKKNKEMLSYAPTNINLHEEYLKRFAKVDNIKDVKTKPKLKSEHDQVKEVNSIDDIELFCFGSKQKQEEKKKDQVKIETRRKKMPSRGQRLNSVSPIREKEKIQTRKRKAF